MSRIAAADIAYSIFADAEIYVERVEDPAVEELVSALLALKRLELAVDSPASHLLDLGRYAAYRACSSLIEWSSTALGIVDLSSEMGDLLLGIAPGSSAHDSAVRVAEAVRTLGTMDRNPLAGSVVEILATGTRGQVAVVLPTARHVAATAELLETLGTNCPVYTARTVVFAPRIETLVAVGPPHWYSDAMLTAPRAFGTTFVEIGKNRAPHASDGLLGQLTPRRIRQTGAAGPFEPIAAEPLDLDLAPSLDWTEILTRANQMTSGVPGAESERARLAGIAGGYFTWLSVDGERPVYTVTLDGLNTAEISRASASALREGDIVLLRSDGADSDFIRTIADYEFGAAAKRSDQTRWKSALRSECDRVGVRGLAVRLKDAGVTEPNLRHWLSESSIRPRDAAEFAATCAAIGLGEETEALWTALSAIHGAHVEAGFRTADLLRSALLERNLDDLRQQGVIEMEIPGAGAVGAYCIEHISDISRVVPVRHLNRRSALEAATWQG